MSKRGRHSPTKRELLAENARLRERVEALEATVEELKSELAAARKNSATASKPSSDIVKLPKPPVPEGAAKRKRGGEWCERIWTVMATCAFQGQSAYAFIAEAVEAYLQGRPAPSLLPAGA